MMQRLAGFAERILSMGAIEIFYWQASLGHG
jgi:hypothetical protein